MIINLEDLNTIRKNQANERLVLTSGTFDLFHVGHLNYLEQVKKYGEALVVLLSGDERVRARKGPARPILNENDRARLLDALNVVDYVFIDPATSPPTEIDPVHAEIVDRLQPDYYVTDGADPRFVDLLEESNFIILERMETEPSTTSIINRIASFSKEHQ
jgi:rfaE bifunctional protein nucleotidyltransferase chain/domain